MDEVQHEHRTIASARSCFSPFAVDQARVGRTLAVCLAALIALSQSRTAIAEGPIGTTGGPEVTIQGCFYYEHENFGGARRDITLGLNRRYVGQSWNDRISAIACSSDCAVRVWEHRDFQGAAKTFAGAISYVGDEWNDRISSMKPICNGDPIAMHPIAFVSGAGKCLDVHAPDQFNNGAKVQVWDCNGSQQQTWARDGKTIRSAAGKCLDVHAPDQDKNGGRVQVWDCNGSPQQQFEWDGRSQVIRTGASKCVDVHAPDQDKNGGRVQVWDCNNTLQQNWNVRGL